MLCGQQDNMMLVGGSRSGKTFTLCKAVASRAIRTMDHDFSRQAILRLHLKDIAESIGMDTWPKMMRLRYPDIGYQHFNKNQGGYIRLRVKTRPKIDWPEIWLLGLDDKERVDKVLGKEFCTLYYNECSQISYSAVTTSQSRLALKVHGLNNRVYYDLNPTGTGHFTYSLFIQGRKPGGMESLAHPENFVYMYMNPLDNAANVADGYIERLMEMPEQQRKRFFEGHYVAALPGALWTLEGIEIHRLRPDDPLLPQFVRIVVAVDPSGASGETDEKADEIGITVMGIAANGHVYLLEDLTGLYSPEGWGKVVAEAYFRWQADRVVAEQNFGGDMVRAIIQGVRINGEAVGQNVPVRMVNASRGKSVRAEPISAMQERGMMHHVGTFPMLEQELTNFTTAGYKGAKSPNRADAYVWGATELFGRNLSYGLTEFLANETAKINKEREERMQKAAKNLNVSVAPAVNAQPGTPDIDPAAGEVAKLDAVPEDGKQPTQGCPKCGALCIAAVPSGGKRCSMCGNQWGKDPLEIATNNRANLFKHSSGRAV